MSKLGFDPEVEVPIPDGWTPLEEVVVVKCLDENGKVIMHHTATPDLNSFEAVGMLIWTERVLEEALVEPDDD